MGIFLSKICSMCYPQGPLAQASAKGYEPSFPSSASSVRRSPTSRAPSTSPSARQRREFFGSDACFPAADLFPFPTKPEGQFAGMEAHNSPQSFGGSYVPTGNLPAWWWGKFGWKICPWLDAVGWTNKSWGGVEYMGEYNVVVASGWVDSCCVFQRFLTLPT